MAIKAKIERKKQQIDAQGKILGRLSTEIALILRGKNKATFLPHIDAGDFVNVTNASKMKFSGKKLDQKVYKRHSGYIGGLKEVKMKDVFEKDAASVLKRSVSRMLPKNKLRKEMLKRLKITN